MVWHESLFNGKFGNLIYRFCVCRSAKKTQLGFSESNLMND